MNEFSDNHTQAPNGTSMRAWLWPGIIVGMLGVHTLGCLIVVYIATSDPSHAVVSDYHRKAVTWDEQQAQARSSDALGWSCSIETASGADMLGERSVRISLRDPDGQPLTDAAVNLSTYHHARASDVQTAGFKEGAPGEYVAMVKMRRPGMWTFEVQALRGDDVFKSHVDQQVGPRSRSTP